MSDNVNIPYQLQQIIQSLLNRGDSVHLRSNYRLRLVTIKEEIESALRKYDQEVMLQDGLKSGKRK